MRLILLLLVSPGSLFGDPAPKSQITTVLDMPGWWTNRLVVEAEAVRLYLLHREDVREGGRREATAGLASAVFVAGPVEPLGLFREAENPLGFGDSSDVFRERSGLSLAADMGIAPRHGVWACTPGGGFSLGGFAKGEEGGRIAAASSISIRDSYSAEILVQEAHPKKAAESSDWFPDKPLYPGGALRNAAARLAARIPLGFAGSFRLGLSAGRSFGERSPAGGFVHASGVQEGEFVESSFLAGFCDPRYVTPAGFYPSVRVLFSGTAEVFPDSFVSPRVHAGYKEERQRRLPVPHPPADEEYSAGLSVGTKLLFCRADAEFDRSRNEDGDRSDGNSFSFDATWRDDFFTLNGRLARKTDESGNTAGSVSLEGELRRPDWDVSARIKGSREREDLLFGKIEAAVRGPGYRLGVSAELVRGLPVSEAGRRDFALHPMRYAMLSLFWNAGTVQSQSPTKRISGSRE